MNHTSAPFPLDGGRVGVGGGRAGFAEDGANGFDGASRAPISNAGANTPSQPSPVEGEGFSRFGRADRASGRMVLQSRRRGSGLMEHIGPAMFRASPFPLDGGRVGVGGGRAGFAEDGANGFDGASRTPISDDGVNTPSQPSPVEGEGFSRFGRADRVSGRLVRRAQSLRAQPTWTEAKIWDRLRLLSVRFRRQVPMGRYVVDFACHRANLVIEIDGGVHQLPEVAVRDLERDAWFDSQGYAVLRISTRQVEDDIDGVVQTIRNAASNRLKQVI